MNGERVISKINIEMNAFNESGSRDDKACAEGLRRARTYVQQEVLKRKILTHDQQVVLNQLCQIFMKQSYKSKMQAVYIFINKGMSDEFLRLDSNESNQVLAAFAEWGMEQEG